MKAPNILNNRFDTTLTSADIDFARWLLSVVPHEHWAELENRWPAVVIVAWADAQKKPLQWEQVAGKFRVSRATAFRWIAKLRGPTYGKRARRLKPDPEPARVVYRAPAEAFAQ